jgi:radical SAM-linked protein
VNQPRNQPTQQAPPVQRLRVQYAKRGRLRFTSHRDFSRAFERAVFRARVPMAYSSGFNPHPRISYAGASPTGAASEAEYLELALAEVVEPDAVHTALSEALPDGLDVVEVVESHGRSLTELLEASHWRIKLATPADEVEPAVRAFLAQTEVLVERLTKKGLRRFDCRAPVLSLTVSASHGLGLLDLVLRHAEPAVRPDDVLAGVNAASGIEFGGVPLLTRLAQGPLDPETGSIGDPLHG